MKQPLTQRRAQKEDLPAIIALLQDDVLGSKREESGSSMDQRYLDAFAQISVDPNQYLMVVEKAQDIVGTCHLTLMPSLTFLGTMRMQIEAVRVAATCRGQKIGAWMMDEAIAYGQAQGVAMVQLTTNKQRPEAKRFYVQLGFEATHEGMKLYLAQDHD